MATFIGHPISLLKWLVRYPGDKVNQRPPVQTEPYKSDLPGFNTRFSLFDLENRAFWGHELTADEQQFLDYVRAKEESIES